MSLQNLPNELVYSDRLIIPEVPHAGVKWQNNEQRPARVSLSMITLKV